MQRSRDRQHPRERPNGEDEQLSALDPSVDLVTLTIGGNDMEFAKILTDCALPNCANGTYKDGKDLETYVKDRADDVVKPALLDTYAQIRAATSPTTSIVVLGYPLLFPTDPDAQGCTALLPFHGEMDLLNELTSYMNDRIREVATASGVTYLDVEERFEGHAPCDSDPWVNGPVGIYPQGDAAFHPKNTGHAQMAQLVNDHLRGTASTPRNAAGLPLDPAPVP